LFPAIQFAIHVRIIEDTTAERWQFVKGKLPNNIKIVTISNYLSQLIPFQNFIIPDPFIFNDHRISGVYDKSQPFQIGIIGRVALSKGIGLLSYLMEELAKQQLTEKFKIHLFGEISEDLPEEIKVFLHNNNAIVLHGYVKNNSAIYNGLHAILHLSETEPLGRVFFEAVDQGLPFIGINAGGIGETSKKFNCTELVIEPDEKRLMAIKLVEKLTMYRNNYKRYIDLISRVRMEMSKQMSIADYCARLDNIINTGKPLN
jgi:glycosyltransferase involved in cell wall biosynthesis